MKIDRLIGIITYLLNHDKTTAPKLAEKFEVSRRTILRDIDTLCCAGIPITTSQGGDGGIAIMEGYKLDKSILTANELDSIIAGLKSLDSVSKTSHIEQIIQKLSPNKNAVVSLHEHIIIDLSSHYKDSLSIKIEQIKSAITQRKLIQFDYYCQAGEYKRKIEPYFIQFKWESWYVFGYCTKRHDFRLFKLNRLWDLNITNEVFVPHHIPPNACNFDMDSKEPYLVSLLFDKSVRFRLIEDYGLNCYTETEDGLYFELDYTNHEYIKSWILSFGDKVTVISPKDFCDEIKEISEKMCQKYYQHDI